MTNSTEQLAKAISEGATNVSLPEVIQGDLRIPYGVTWQVTSKVRLQDGAKLYIDGPPGAVMNRQIFDALPGQIRGSFGGVEVNVGWWSGFDPDEVDDMSQHIEAAAQALRPGGDALGEWNRKLSVKYITGDFTGGTVRLPAGLWPVRKPIDLGNRYVSLVGCGEGSALHFMGLDDVGINIKGEAKNSSISHMAWIVDPSCGPEFVTCRLDSGFLEGTHFSHLFIRGTRRATFETRGMSSNHFRVSDCHIIDPQNPDSTAFLGRALSDRFSWHNNTIAQIGRRGYWKRMLDLSGYDRVSIRDCHFECAQEACVHINDERGRPSPKRPSILVESCFHNFGNGYWEKGNRPKDKGALVMITSPHAAVTVIQSQTTNGDTVIIDEPYEYTLKQTGTGNNIVVRYERSVVSYSSVSSNGDEKGSRVGTKVVKRGRL
jgi:hypothetical protein